MDFGRMDHVPKVPPTNAGSGNREQLRVPLLHAAQAPQHVGDRLIAGFIGGGVLAEGVEECDERYWDRKTKRDGEAFAIERRCWIAKHVSSQAKLQNNSPKQTMVAGADVSRPARGPNLAPSPQSSPAILAGRAGSFARP